MAYRIAGICLMVLSVRRLNMVAFLLGFFSTGFATPNENLIFRDFWSPTYHIERLNHCLLDGKTCGLEVAHQYCQLMGYNKASKALIEYNVGLTHILWTRTQCKSWRCNGFKVISCVGHFKKKPVSDVYYREKRFVFPRLRHYRVDWCYADSKGCGKQAANAFCQVMGYRRAARFKQQIHVPATKSIGSQKLCFGPACSSFEDVICYR